MREPSQKPQDFPVKFPVSWEIRCGERFARDCVHRHLISRAVDICSSAVDICPASSSSTCSRPGRVIWVWLSALKNSARFEMVILANADFAAGSQVQGLLWRTVKGVPSGVAGETGWRSCGGGPAPQSLGQGLSTPGVTAHSLFLRDIHLVVLAIAVDELVQRIDSGARRHLVHHNLEGLLAVVNPLLLEV